MAVALNPCRAHPEFERGRVSAYVVAPGMMLVRIAEPAGAASDAEEYDPVLAAYLGFVETQMTGHPALLRELTSADVAGLDDLLDGVVVDLDAPLEDADDFVLPLRGAGRARMANRRRPKPPVPAARPTAGSRDVGHARSPRVQPLRRTRVQLSATAAASGCVHHLPASVSNQQQLTNSFRSGGAP